MNKLPALFLLLMVVVCNHDFDNPSDPESSRYSVRSEAEVGLVSQGTFRVGDTVAFYCGITSGVVDEDGLVEEYRIDFDGNGGSDTVIRHPDTLVHVYTDEGKYTCRLICLDKAGFKDSAKCTVTISPAKTVSSLYMIFIMQGDSVSMKIDGDTTVQIISDDGDTLRVKTDRQTDSIAVISLRGDTLRIARNDADTLTIRVVPSDSVPVITITTEDTTITELPDTVTVEPQDTVVTDSIRVPDYLPEFPKIPGFPENLEGECAFFAEDSSLMRTTMNCYDVMWEQTRSDGYQTLEFIGKMVGDILGYSLVIVFGNDYAYTFDNGVYRITTDSFTVSCAFHYGAGLDAHAENDTVRADIFAMDSYVSGLHVTLTPPFYAYTKGPLYDLIDGDVSIDGSLNVTFGVNFSRLKLSFFRETVHNLAPFPLGIVNDSVQLAMRHDSYARMAPVPVRSFDDRFHNDSIIIDHSGTTMTSQPVELEVIYAADSGYRKAEYALTTRQVMNSQNTAYGNHGDTLKLSGSYRATTTLGFDGHEQSVYFSGRYSSAVNDSSWFYCDSSLTDEFGTLFFGDGDGVTGQFTSDKFGYSFRYTPLRALP